MLRTRCCHHTAISQEGPSEGLGWSELKQHRWRLWLRRAGKTSWRKEPPCRWAERSEEGIPSRRSRHLSRDLWECRGVPRTVRRKQRSRGSDGVPAPSTGQPNGVAANCGL